MTEGTGVSPDFLSLIQHAARETVRIPLATSKLAVKLRQRIHSARKQLIRAADKPHATERARALASLANDIETSIEVDAASEAVFLVVRPRDSAFREALRAAGVPLDSTAPSIISEPTPGAADPAEDPVAAYLRKGENS